MKTLRCLCVLALVSWSVGSLGAATFDQARISYIQNDVAVADIKLLTLQDGSVVKTAAALNQEVNNNQAVVTGDKSRAELKFNDNTIVRLGQFTVFTFKEGTRDLNLKQGSMLMHVPKGMGRTNIQAAAITAAITGTTVLFQAGEGFASVYVYEGTVQAQGFTLGPGDALIYRNGKFTVEKFDPSKGVKTAALFTKFMDSPNNAPFTLDAILGLIAEQIGAEPPSGPDDTRAVDGILNRLIEREITRAPGENPNNYLNNNNNLLLFGPQN